MFPILTLIHVIFPPESQYVGENQLSIECIATAVVNDVAAVDVGVACGLLLPASLFCCCAKV